MKSIIYFATRLFVIGVLLLPFSAHSQIVGSQHDLTVGGNAQASTAVTDQVCVFCHTPHGSNVNAPVPLWNKVLGNPGSYTQYSTLATPTFDSAEAPVGSVSLACLSCHDGTQAMDVVINSPGSNGYNAGGAQIDPGAVGQLAGTPIPVLGTDLTNDHPISMQYGGGGLDLNDPVGQAPAGSLGDPAFNLPFRDDINNQPIWWVDSAVGTTGVRERTDMLLYTRNDLGIQEPFVECGSCHDPHNSSTQSPSQVAFLRVSNAASAVCTACHIK